jgi:hypothetical protein
MPAITLARLRQQAALLAEHFDQPAAFVRSLHHLLEFYADRTHRPGQAGEPPPLLAAYSVSQPVLRQILLELIPRAEIEPEKGLALCDALWAEPVLEFRMLAAWLLGTLPAPPATILNRAQSWIQAYSDERLLAALLQFGLAHVRSEHPNQLFQQVGIWLEDPSRFAQQIGLRALIPLLSSAEYDNLPAIFQLITPFARQIPAQLRPDLLDAMHALALRSPQETAYFLHENLNALDNPDTPWLIRQCLADFPPEIQEGLRLAAREAERQK